MDLEKYIVSKFTNKFNGDDCAVIKETAYCKDIFAEGTHFLREWLSLREIGAKAMLVNISDMIVMNACPKYALLGLTLPRDFTLKEADELCAGLNETARAWKIAVIGGDTIGGDKISISITLIGGCKAPVRRSGAHIGDLVAYTGVLGGVGRDLKILLNGGSRADLNENSRFIAPLLRDKFFHKAAKFIHAAMDISDGLEQDLPRLLEASEAGLRWLKRLSDEELQSGEEYEVLFSFAPKFLPKIYAAAAKTNTPVNIIAQIVPRKADNSFEFRGKSHHFGKI